MNITDSQFRFLDTRNEIVKLFEVFTPAGRINKVFMSDESGIYYNGTVYSDQEVIEEYIRRCSDADIEESTFLTRMRNHMIMESKSTSKNLSANESYSLLITLKR